MVKRLELELYWLRSSRDDERREQEFWSVPREWRWEKVRSEGPPGLPVSWSENWSRVVTVGQTVGRNILRDGALGKESRDCGP